jgi:hypothetical protein
MHISRDMIFNEAELVGNMSIRNLPQDITALINIIIISLLAENKENKENKSIAAKIRKTIFKIIFKIELSKEVVRITEIFAKFIDMIVSRRNPNIVYEDFIEENLILSKIMIVKTISNKDKSSYEAAMINLKIF